ncbi:MAG: hypothetical protein RR573_04780 [Oscillospiraceae bacterium]
MTTILACLIAGISTVAFVTLWFRVVRRELYAKQKAEDAAMCQLIASRQSYMRARDGPKDKQAQEILEISEQVHNQSVQLYNEALHKPLNVIPGILMGFRTITDTVEL